jgi:CO/xanthine dehydrogenase Mo-binding subunit
MSPAAAAIANAGRDATGVLITEVPISPERVALGVLAQK